MWAIPENQGGFYGRLLWYVTLDAVTCLISAGSIGEEVSWMLADAAREPRRRRGGVEEKITGPLSASDLPASPIRRVGEHHTDPKDECEELEDNFREISEGRGRDARGSGIELGQ